jgi:hypothetical protein
MIVPVFRSERTRILAQLAEAADDNNKDVTALPTDYSSHSKEALHRLKGSSGPAKFQAMAKTIAQRWRALTEPEREPYEAKAAVELTAYQKRKDDYHRNLVRQSDDFWTEGKQPATTTASEATASVLDYSKNQDDSSRSGWTPTAVDPLMGMTLMGSMSPTREGTIPYASLSSLMMGGGMGLPTLSSLTGSSLADSRFAASFSRLTSPASFLRLPPASSHMASLFGSGSVGGVNPGLLLLQQRQQQREQEDSMLRAALLSQHQQQQQLQQRDDMLMQAQNHHQQREQQDLVFRLQAAEELLQQRQEAAAQQSHAESQFRVDPQALARLSPEDRRLVLMRMLEGGGAQGSLGDFRR